MILRVIKNWLRRKLGVVVNIIPGPFLRSVRDGTLIAQILLSYNLISEEEQQSILESDDVTIAYENYNNYIKTWLERVNIEITEKDIYEIVHGDGTIAITLFYDLFLELENKNNHLYYPKENIKGKFAVHTVAEKSYEMAKFAPNPLCEPLARQWDIISWEKDHLNALTNKYIKNRKKYDEYLEEKNIKSAMTKYTKTDFDEVALPPIEVPSADSNYHQLLNEQKDAQHMDPFQPNLAEAKRIFNKIKRKNKHHRDMLASKQQLEQELLLRLKDEIKAESKQNFDKVIVEKILRQSQREKELAEKIMEIRKQKELMKQRKFEWDEAEKKRQEDELIKRIFMEELDARLRFHDERQKLIAEHKKLYELKWERKAKKHEKVCRDVVSDLVDLAIKTSEYKEKYQMEPQPATWDEWATLFVKQQPILDDIEIGSLKMISEGVEEVFQKSEQRQEILDSEDLQNYVSFLNQWSLIELSEEDARRMQLGLNCLGYSVHRVLLKMFPLPIPAKPDLCPEIEVAVCVTLEDTTKLPYFKRLLALKNIVVVEMEDAMKFCMDAYEVEKKTEFDDPFPDADLKELAPSQKGAKGKKGKKDKKKAKKEKKDKKSKKGKKDKDSGPPPVEKDDKQAQTPRLFPWEYLNLSNKARLGKFVKGEMELGRKIDDKTLVEMFVEYLASFKDMKGWVLVNYPNNFRQAALLEMSLSGKPVPSEYYGEEMNRESLESVILPTVATENTGELTISGSFDPNFNDDINVQRPSVSETYRVQEKEEQETHPSAENVATTNGIVHHFASGGSFGQSIENLHTTQSKDHHPKATSRSEDYGKSKKNVSIGYVRTIRSLYDIDSQNMFEPDAVDQTTYDTVNKLLPDLVKLAFSSEFFSQADVEKKNKAMPAEEVYTCQCQCADMQNSYSHADMTKKSVISTRMGRSTEDGINAVDFEGDEDAIPELELVEDDDGPLQRAMPEDPDRDRRKSQLVPNPRPLENEEYQTVLTAYIRAMTKEDEFADVYDDDPLKLYAEIEQRDGLEKFYCDQGCFYLLQHEVIDSETIKCLAKMVIGDYSIPLKSSFELFGERYLEAQFEVGDNLITKKGKKDRKDKKKGGSKKSKKSKASEDGGGAKKKDKKSKKDKGSKKSSKSSKGSKKGKKGKKGAVEPETPKTFEDKEIQWPLIEEEEEEPEPKPGEANWDYISLPIPPDIEYELADFWYSFESNYVRDFKLVFSNRRTCLNEFIPYLSQVRQIMLHFIQREDARSFYLREFQKTLNEIDLDLRDDEQTKATLIDNISSFKEKLWGISDSKMQESEQRRQNFIRENWIFRQISDLVYNSKLAFQLEIDRFIDSINFITDYYESIIRKAPTNKREFPKEILQIENVDDQNGEFNGLFIEATPKMELNSTQFHTYIDNLHRACKLMIEQRLPIAFDAMKDAKKLFEPSSPSAKSTRRNKEKGEKSKKSAKQPKFELDEDVKEESDRIFDEWQCAIDGELVRANFHLDLLQDEMAKKLEGVIEWVRRIFMEIFEAIKKLYDMEVKTTEMACDLLQKCVEQEEILRPELSFDNDRLIAIRVELFPQIEDYSDGKLNLAQLSYMYDVFDNLSADGSILQSTFMLLLQDMFYRADEDVAMIEEEEGKMVEVPKLWRNLTPALISKFNEKFFDNNYDYVHWKDFIVSNLLIPFPSHEELMETRAKFLEMDEFYTELVEKRDFMEVCTWFDSMIEHEELRTLLAKMYAYDAEERVNWTAMLLDFCKDFDRIEGFTKALELALGRLICRDHEMGERFISEVDDQRRLYADKLAAEGQEELDLAKEAVDRAVNEFVEGALRQGGSSSAGLIITELKNGHGDEQNRLSSGKVDNSATNADGSSMTSENNRFLLDAKYTDSEVGFESRENTNYAHFLPFETVEVVVKAVLMTDRVLSQRDEEQCAEGGAGYLERMHEIYNECRNEQFNCAVLSHEFLNNEKLEDLLKEMNKFYAGNPIKVIREVVENNEEGMLLEEIEEADNQALSNMHRSIDETSMGVE